MNSYNRPEKELENPSFSVFLGVAKNLYGEIAKMTKINSYFGRLFLRHNAPHPLCGLGCSCVPGSFLAPRLNLAFTFSPYKTGSFPFTIPHCISAAQLPVTKGVAMEVPVSSV